MFGEISPRYDFLNHFLSGGHRFLLAVADRAPGRPQGTQPDPRCVHGDGRPGGGVLAARPAAMFACVGADFTHEMLKLGPAKDGDRLQFQPIDSSRPTRSDSPLPTIGFKSSRSHSGCET